MALSSKAEKAHKKKEHNAGKGEKADGWTWKDAGKIISQGEKNLYNADVDIFWQKNAWVDKVVMRRELARNF